MFRPIARTARVGRIGTMRVQPPARPDLAERPRGVEQLSLVASKFRDWERLIGRDRLRAVERLMETGVVGTLPELCVYGWLEQRKHLFEFQSSLMGGRLLKGGAVADFVILDMAPGGLVVWRVQGEYWHGTRESRQRDRAQRDRLLCSWYGGMPIIQVVDLWEYDIYRRFPEVFKKAEVGVELR